MLSESCVETSKGSNPNPNLKLVTSGTGDASTDSTVSASEGGDSGIEESGDSQIECNPEYFDSCTYRMYGAHFCLRVSFMPKIMWVVFPFLTTTSSTNGFPVSRCQIDRLYNQFNMLDSGQHGFIDSMFTHS